MAAYAKGAPVRISARRRPAPPTIGTRKQSDIKTLQDTDGKTIAFSTNGSSTHSIVLAFIKEFGLKAKPTATGNPSATLTAVMTDQVDVGWASPPFGLKEMEDNAIRVVAKATDARWCADRPSGCSSTNTDALAKRKDVHRALHGGLPRDASTTCTRQIRRSSKDYAEFVGVPETIAKRVRDEFFPKSLLDPDEIKGLDVIIPEAVALKFIPAPLTKEQTAS